MVLEALAAVGLAGNVAQFIDFSCKLFSVTCEIHHSTTGASKGVEDIATVAQQLNSLSTKLSLACQTRRNTSRPTSDEEALEKLAKQCENAARELVLAIDDLRPDDRSKWNSFRSCLATVWQLDKIRDMEQRLDSYRSQLIVHLAVMHRSV
jgi:hypothetical protein